MSPPPSPSPADPLLIFAVELLAEWADEESKREQRAADRWGGDADAVASDPEKVEEHTNLTYEAQHAAGRSTGLGMARNKIQRLLDALKERG